MSGQSTPAQAAGHRPRPPASGRLPDFFIAGHPKSGTTALYEMLRAHPQLAFPPEKEPWFFAEELHERPPPRPTGQPATLEEYGAMFAHAGPEQLVGEATPMYLWSKTAAARIAEVCPRARFVVILREPASFLSSLHLQLVQTYVETETDLRRALELEARRREGRELPRYTYWPQALLYSDFVRYTEQLARFESRFGRERMLVLIYDDFRADNIGTVQQVRRFLGVDDSLPVQQIEANPSVQVRSRRLHEMVHAVSVGRGPVSHAVKGTIKALTPRRLRRKALFATQDHLVYSRPRERGEDLMSELRERYRGEVQTLSEHLGRDLLTLWGYDGDS